MNESENKQLATNASIDRERMRYVNALFNGTSNTKRQRLYQEFGYPKELCFDDFYRAYRRNAIAGAAVTRMDAGKITRKFTKATRLRMQPSKRIGINGSTSYSSDAGSRSRALTSVT